MVGSLLAGRRAYGSISYSTRGLYLGFYSGDQARRPGLGIKSSPKDDHGNNSRTVSRKKIVELHYYTEVIALGIDCDHEFAYGNLTKLKLCAKGSEKRSEVYVVTERGSSSGLNVAEDGDCRTINHDY